MLDREVGELPETRDFSGHVIVHIGDEMAEKSTSASGENKLSWAVMGAGQVVILDNIQPRGLPLPPDSPLRAIRRWLGYDAG